MNADINERRAAISGVGLAMAGRRADRSALDLTLVAAAAGGGPLAGCVLLTRQ